MNPSIFDYLPEEGHKLFKMAGVQKQEPLHLSPAVARAALKALGVITVGGGLGYAGGKMLAGATLPKVHPGYYAALGTLLAGAVLGGQAYQDKKMLEVLRRAQQNQQERARQRA